LQTISIGVCNPLWEQDKDGWVQFWEFGKSLHPSLDRFDTTIITDQAKGLKEAIYQVLPNAVHFHCSFHRRQNIAKIVKGGNVKYSCLWLFNKLVKVHTKQEIEHIKHKHSQYVDKKALKYLNTLDNKEVYPGARCDLGGRIFMYQRSASLAVESVNRANKSACARTAVDVVLSTRLLLKLSASRYQEETRLATVSVPESDFFSAKNKKKSRIFSTEIRRNFCETFSLGQS
jgi:hypothetical protein